MSENRHFVLCSVCIERRVVADAKERPKERALVPIKSKLVVAVYVADFQEITLMRNVNVMWAGGNGCLNKLHKF